MNEIELIIDFLKNSKVPKFFATYLTTAGLDLFASTVKKKFTTTSFENQFISALNNALYDTCEKFGMEHDYDAISETLQVSLPNIIANIDEDGLYKILSDAIGANDMIIGDECFAYWVDRFDIHISNIKNVWANTYIFKKYLRNAWSEQKNGISISDGHAFAQSFLLKKIEGWHYLKQTFKFVVSGEIMPARPMIDNNYDWWLTLIDKLSIAPILLIGPGGMGKSTFLTYLYSSINDNYPVGSFAKVVLISLESLIISAENEPIHNTPFTEPRQSILLNHIASTAGDKNASLGWYRAMKEGKNLYNRGEILLLLDGLSEMRSRKQAKENIYNQIISEIADLSDKKRFPFLHMIITSRVEAPTELKAQLNDLDEAKVNFILAELEGISEELPNIKAQKMMQEMRNLLKRPMYYYAFKDYTENDIIPLTRYDALKKMYKAICDQRKEYSAMLAEDRKVHECIFEVFLPIIAKQMLFKGKFTSEDFDDCYAELRHRCSLILINDKKFASGGVEKASKLVEKIIEDAYDILSKQEQILIVQVDNDDVETYIFRHQDYRDFLAAEYYLQRLSLILKKMNDECWEDINFNRNLNLESYNKDTLKLIYQALDFVSKFVSLFSKPILKLYTSHKISGYLLWQHAAYQLSDLCELAEVAYDKYKLGEDTLQVLEPLTTYAREEADNIITGKALLVISESQKQWLTNTLMKSCEWHRKNGEFEIARKITEAAKYLYSSESEEEKKNNWMLNVINHNIAKVNLYDFMKNGTEHLSDSLDMLFDCALGIGNVEPNIFSCNILSMILVSPQSYLACRDEYMNFLQKRLPNDEPPVVFAFWTYYRAMYKGGKQLHDCLSLNYTMRQLLFLLAENKVQITKCNPEELDITALEVEKRRGKLSVISTLGSSEFPSKANMVIIERFLKETDILQGSSRTYFHGLVSYIKNEKIQEAYAYFAKASNESSHTDIRSRMWLACFNKDIEILKSIWIEGSIKSINNPNINIDSYNMKEWYDRDITMLYKQLRLEVSKLFMSETKEALTKFLFIGKSLEELGKYDLVIVLGNDDISGTINVLNDIVMANHLTDDCHIILSGNVGSMNKDRDTEAERFFNKAIEIGMPEELFWLEKSATNALENYRYSKEIIESQGGFEQFNSILCIGKAFMMRRAKMCAAACGYPINKMEFYGTVDREGCNIGPETWWESETSRIRVMEELRRISDYTLKGDLSID